ncbi:MAG: ABC transporter permease, partial [Clostridiales bacterium]|nr:ABC transporter permease [Clostridiales bacterium]
MVKKRLDSLTSILYPLIFGVLIVVMWQTGVLHKLFKTDEYILPYPTRIFSIIAENTSKIMPNVGASMFVIIIGLLLGS